jgi:xanthine dehydrogenase accessory factor
MRGADALAAATAQLARGGRGALATVVRTGGSTPQLAGARLYLGPDDRLVGTVGGGAIEHATIEALRACRQTGKPTLLARDLAKDLGMCCGGRMEIFVEPVEAAPRLVIFGAGHVGAAVARLAREVGFAPTVVDDREELNAAERLPGVARVLATPRASLATLAPTEHDWILVTTHDHRLDEEALDVFARAPHRYLGVIGSQRKQLRILARIAHRTGGLPPLERAYGPVGLDLGAVTPTEIAVSIVAELVALRHGRPAAHLSRLGDPAFVARALRADPAAATDDAPDGSRGAQ